MTSSTVYLDTKSQHSCKAYKHTIYRSKQKIYKAKLIRKCQLTCLNIYQDCISPEKNEEASDIIQSMRRSSIVSLSKHRHFFTILLYPHTILFFGNATTLVFTGLDTP